MTSPPTAMARHDFSAFRGARCAAGSPTLTLHELEVVEERPAETRAFRHSASPILVRMENPYKKNKMAVTNDSAPSSMHRPDYILAIKVAAAVIACKLALRAAQVL